MIKVTCNGESVFLGHAIIKQDITLHANGRDRIAGDTAPLHANIDALPSAADGTGLMGATRIATPTGPCRVDELRTGDLVLNADGDQATVRHVLTAPAPRDAYLIRAPYYGLDQDTILGPKQQLVVTSDIAEYLFGEDTVMVPAWALSDGRKVVHFETRASDLLYQVQLDSAAPLKIGNCAIAALYKDGLTEGRSLSQEEARCFSSEHRIGFQN